FPGALQDIRCTGVRLLRRQPTDLCGSHAQRLHAGDARAVVLENAGAGSPDLSLRQSARGESGRWGQGLTAAKMKDCRWLKPVLVGQFEFLEWTGENHLRHTNF